MLFLLSLIDVTVFAEMGTLQGATLSGTDLLFNLWELADESQISQPGWSQGG